MHEHNRLILAAEDVLDHLGTRTEQGERITAEWGKPIGWAILDGERVPVYEPTFTAHYEDRLPISEPVA